MNKSSLAIVLSAAFVFSGALAHAGACDYRPSQLLGGFGAGASTATAVGTAAAGTGMKGAGFYSITHFITGAPMLGSTAGGASAAGTVGIMGGTGGAIGAVGAFLMAPATIVGATVAAVGVGGWEGACAFYADRVTDYEDVLNTLQSVAEHVDPSYLRLYPATDKDDKGAILLLRNSKGVYQEYEVKNLYIVNGIMKHRDWGVNTSLLPLASLPRL